MAQIWGRRVKEAPFWGKGVKEGCQGGPLLPGGVVKEVHCCGVGLSRRALFRCPSGVYLSRRSFFRYRIMMFLSFIILLLAVLPLPPQATTSNEKRELIIRCDGFFSIFNRKYILLYF